MVRVVDVDKQRLLDLYVSGERVVNIARILGVSTTTVFNRLNAYGIREKVKSKNVNSRWIPKLVSQRLITTNSINANLTFLKK